MKQNIKKMFLFFGECIDCGLAPIIVSVMFKDIRSAVSEYSVE